MAFNGEKKTYRERERREWEEGAPNYNWNFANGRGGFLMMGIKMIRF